MTSSLKYILESIDARFGKLPEVDDPDDELLDEDNTTASIEGFDTPEAFGKKKHKADGAYSEPVPETHNFYKKIAESIAAVDFEVNKNKNISELAYPDFKSDDTKTDRQKINLNIKEINRKLSEVEQMIRHSQKFKNEIGADSGVFYKDTFNRFQKISERLMRISSKIREFNT